MIFRVVAIWTPAGARIADSSRMTLYRGGDQFAAESAYDLSTWLVAGARASGLRGAIACELRRDSDLLAAWCRTIGAPNPGAPAPARSPGYPAHDCGGPMVPGDIAGMPCGARQLVCVRCGVPVDATPEQQLRAQTAARAEREGRAA